MLKKMKELMPARMRHEARSWRYFGWRYACPFCGWHFRKLLPKGFDIPVLRELRVVGGRRRLNVQCPRCHSSDRERLLYLFLTQENVVGSRAIRLLHVAPERNLRNFLAAQPNITYVKGDKFEPGYSYPQDTISLDVVDLPFADHDFDFIICNHVLEHVPDDREAMRELYRVLKPGGRGILQVPWSSLITETLEDPSVVSAAERERAYGQRDHVRLYARDDYLRRLQDARFGVAQWRPSAGREDGLAIRYALDPEEDVIAVSKSSA